MAKGSGLSWLLRAFLVLFGLGLLVVVYAGSRFPRPTGERIEAALGVVGVTAGGSYAWVVKTANGAVLVDAGADVKGEHLLEELRSQGVTPAQVQAVLITHAHPDHWAGAHLFPNAKVYLGAEDVPYLQGEREFEAFGGRLAATFLDRGPVPSKLEPLTEDRELELDGAKFRSLKTPGHTPGSTCYLYGDLLFTGDSVLKGGEELTLAPSFLSEEPEQVRASLRRLLALPFTRTADGHAGAAIDARQKLERVVR